MTGAALRLAHKQVKSFCDFRTHAGFPVHGIIRTEKFPEIGVVVGNSRNDMTQGNLFSSGVASARRKTSQ